MGKQGRLKAELQRVALALEELESEYSKGRVDVSRYLDLKAGYAARQRELEQELDKALAGVALAHEVPSRHAEPARRRMPVSTWFAVGAVCLAAALACAVASRWLPGANPATATLTPTPTFTPTSTLTSTLMPTLTPSPTVALTFTPTSLSPGNTKTRSSDGMVMVYVPGGTFEMGSNDGLGDAQPAHNVTLDSFWIDRTEVSNAQYALCVESGKCRISSYVDDDVFNGSEYPVVGVSWQDAADYCQWAGGQLPTEAEWEYAARGEQGFVYPWGNESDCSRGNFSGECDREYDKTSPVDSFESGESWCGVLNMAGNVWEWVDDWYDGYPGTSYQSDSFGMRFKVIRGGSWSNNSLAVRTDYRGRSRSVIRCHNIGLRCVVELGG